MKNFFLFGFLYVLSFGCHSPKDKGVDRQAVLEEMKEREIKHVLPGEIVEAAYEQGDTIAQQTQQMLITQYSQANETLSDFLHTKTAASVNALEKKYQADIRWISVRDTTSNQLGNLERQILQAYLYNVEHKLDISHNVQRIDDESYLYTKPLVLHDDLREELAALQKTLLDTTTFLGMWSIRLSKKQIILDM